MRLKKIDIIGFKSFGEKTAIEFPEGVTAIIGPNGCGKSNVVDAARWAMGEQSVKQLRGKDREDIIFAGTADAAPLNLAEVTLTLANEDGTVTGEWAGCPEIALTRRLFRSGDSGYFINRRPCRLKDIHSVFMGSGVSSRSYAIIQQGNIGAITDAGPEERRTFIEEAARITTYKARRSESQKKLEATEQNLLRAADIVAEVARQLAGLKRQARKAEKYQALGERLRHLDIRLTLKRMDALDQEIRKAGQLLASFRDEDLRQAADMQKLEAAVEKIHLDRTRRSEALSALRGRQYDLGREIEREEAGIAHLKKDAVRLKEEGARFRTEQEELRSRLSGMEKEITESRERRTELERRISALEAGIRARSEALMADRQEQNAVRTLLESLTARLMDLAAREAAARERGEGSRAGAENLAHRRRKADEEYRLAARRKSGLERELSDLAEKRRQGDADLAAAESRTGKLREELRERAAGLSAQVKRVGEISGRRQKTAAGYQALKKLADTRQWYREGVRAVLEMGDGHPGIQGVAADLLSPEEGASAALEGLLGERLQFVVVDRAETAAGFIAALAEGKRGRCGFLALDAVRALPETISGGASGPGAENGPDAGKKDRLLDRAGAPGKLRPAFGALLGAAAAAPDLPAAMARVRDTGHPAVTPAGDAVFPDGVMIGGGPESLSGILDKQRELRDLKAELAVLDAELAAETTRRREMEAGIRTREEQLRAAVTAGREAAEAVSRMESGRIRLTEQIRHEERNLERGRLRLEEIEDEADSAEKQAASAERLLRELQADTAALQAEIAEVSARDDRLTEKLRAADEGLSDARLDLTTQRAEAESLDAVLRRLQGFRAEGESRLDRLSADAGNRETEAAEALAEAETRTARLMERHEDRREADREVREMEADFAAVDAEYAAVDDDRNRIRARREDVLGKIRLLEVDVSGMNARKESLAEQFTERHDHPPDRFRSRLPGFQGGDLTEDGLKTEIAELRRRIEKMGGVNPDAVREYEELLERHRFLEAQREDLIRAVEDLRQVIREINRITREKFTETFGLVNEKLKEVFPRLFGGGTARLELTEPDNPLDSGVEFMVHPPGKKLGRMTLLSGGEKALAAIAFVFSIFLIRPACFCILDEIDAPLDEANVNRFNGLLKLIGEQSQIIMITHKKTSMAFADCLFGVTMEQKGISRVLSVRLDDLVPENTGPAAA